MVLESLYSDSSIIFKFIICFFALLEALNSTGNVINWNNNIANNRINPKIAICVNPNIIPIIITRYPIFVDKFTKGTMADLIFRNAYPSLC